MKSSIVVLISLFYLCSAASAGTITPGLSERYAKEGGAQVPVLIALASRLDAPFMQDELLKSKLPLADTHERVLDSMRARASASQPNVLSSLEILKSTGMAGEVRTFWIANIIATSLTRAGVELIANMAEVREVGLDEEVMLSSPVSVAIADSPTSVSSHLETVHATEAWTMGFRGENRTICIIADGVNAEHSALSARWRGRIAPVEQSWMDASNPSTCGEQGTMMAGLICGDQTGIAPAAYWIGSKSICDIARLSDVIAALQWAADPDSNSATFADVPDAICCAWIMNSSCADAAPATVWDVTDNVEALGPVIVFAVGNSEREGMSTVGAPASRDGNLSVGNADATGATILAHSTSARGPSPCDGSVKPDLMAPGTTVLSSTTNGYARVTGTSVAAAQVAGAVALMRQANPKLSAQDIKRMLTLSATDLGSPHEDNATGHGLLNTGAAVRLAQSARGTGSIGGIVRYGGEPVVGARVVLASEFGETTTLTSRNGTFQFDHLASETPYQISVGRFGYQYYVHEQVLLANETVPQQVTIHLQRGFLDDVEQDQGWILGVEGDDATSGIWERAIPAGTHVNENEAEPAADASAEGEYCFVTGAASPAETEANATDVDGGHTSLRSPVFDVTELTDPALQFSYDYSNDLGSNRGSDFFRAQISSDGGDTWTNLINTAAATHGWKTVSVKIADFVTPTDRMVLQFIAEDDGSGSLVEAAVDEISITGVSSAPEPPRDLLLDVQFDQVVLRWRSSPEAGSYRIYLSNRAADVVRSENLFMTTQDTTLTVPMSDIPYGEFYFQVTAVK